MKNVREYIDRYFEGELSSREEQELKEFLCTPEGQSPEYDEVRAVMGFFATGRALEAAPSGRIFTRVAAAAACIAVVLGIGLNVHRQNNSCIAYVNGEKVTDKEAVMDDVENTLSLLLSDGYGVEMDLSEFFGE